MLFIDKKTALELCPTGRKTLLAYLQATNVDVISAEDIVKNISFGDMLYATNFLFCLHSRENSRRLYHEIIKFLPITEEEKKVAATENQSNTEGCSFHRRYKGDIGEYLFWKSPEFLATFIGADAHETILNFFIGILRIEEDELICETKTVKIPSNKF